MTQLSERARALVDRARREAEPSDEELRHMRARLTAGLAKQGFDPVLLPFSLSKLGSVVLAASVGLGAWYLRGAVSEHDRALSSLPTAPPAAAVSCPPPAACPAPLAEASSKSRPKAQECVTPNKLRAEGVDGASAGGGLRQSLFSAAPAKRDSGSIEIELLILAREAVDENRPFIALGHVMRHQQLFPKSAFEEERLAIEVLACCLADRPALAAQRFEQLVELAPGTAYLPRIRDTCGERFVHPPENRDSKDE